MRGGYLGKMLLRCCRRESPGRLMGCLFFIVGLMLDAVLLDASIGVTALFFFPGCKARSAPASGLCYAILRTRLNLLALLDHYSLPFGPYKDAL